MIPSSITRDLFRKSGGPPKQSRRAPTPGTEQGFSPRPVAGFTELVNVGLAAKLFVSK
jgi:hypothetical protein